MAAASPARDAGPMPTQLHTADLDTAETRAQRAGPGSTVEVVDRAGRRTTYEIVGRPPGPVPRRVTIGSAEGRALLWARPGDTLTIPAENGRQRRVSVVGVTPSASHREDDLRPGSAA
jgi:transcription elongation GreA/GreB family factor